MLSNFNTHRQIILSKRFNIFFKITLSETKLRNFQVLNIHMMSIITVIFLNTIAGTDF